MGQIIIHGRMSNMTANAKSTLVPLLMVASVLVLTDVTLAGETNTTCPVIKSNLVVKSIFIDYKGKKVFFCSQSCKAKFEENPEKYLPRLSQFASTTAKNGPDGNHEKHNHTDTRILLIKLIKPIGIATLLLMAITVTLGILRRLKPRLMLKIHKICGVLALMVGAVHAALVLFLF